MTHLALDLSKSSTGWAVWSAGWEKPRYGHWVLGSEYTSRGQVFQKLLAHLDELHMLTKFQFVSIEQPINPDQLRGYTTIQTLRLAAGLASTVEQFCFQFRSTADFPSGVRSIHEVNLESWRPEFIGRDVSNDLKSKVRRARKAGDKRATARQDLKTLTIERCRQLGLRPKTDDEADAIGILTYALLLDEITPPWLANETLRPELTGAVA